MKINHGLDVLTAAITDKEKLNLLMWYDEDIFTEGIDRYIFKVMKEHYEAETPVTLHSVMELAERDGRDGQVNSYLISGFTGGAVVFDYEALLGRMENRARERKIKMLAHDITEKTVTEKDIEDKIYEIVKLSDHKKVNEVTSFLDIANKSLDDAFPKTKFTKTGIQELDEIMVGMFSTQLIIIAARPRLGKTSLAVQIATSVKVPSLFISLEMSKSEIYGRMLSGKAEVESWRIEAKRLTDEEIPRVIEAREHFRDRFSHTPLYFADGLSDKNRILSTMRRYVQQKHVGVIFVDYLQLMGGGEGQSKNDQVGDITKAMKAFSMKYNVPVVMLSQLNRTSERSEREPILSDLRDSGSIEQDADAVIFIHEKDGNTYLIQAKNRKVGSKKIDICFEKKFTRFGRVREEKFEEKSRFAD